MAAANTVTVCSKLPFGFVAEFGGKKVTFRGVGHGEEGLSDAYGLTPGVDADWYAGWVKDAGDFAPLQSGVIFSSADNKAADESAEMQGDIASGLEQKSAEDLGVEVVEDDKPKKK